MLQEQEPINPGTQPSLDEINAVRCGDKGIALTLFLCLPENHELESEWLENEGWTIGGLSAELSEALLVWLNKQIAGVRPVNDEAASSLSLLATMGVDRQAWIAPLIEGLHETLPYTSDKDRFEGYATENAKRRALYTNRIADAVESDTDEKADEYEANAREWVEEIMARLDGGQQ